VGGLAAALAATAGCGYTTRSLYPEGVRTVMVPTFASREFRREIEFEVSREVVKLIEMRTPYKVVHSGGRADSELRGEILDLEAPVLTENLDTDQPQDVQVSIACWIEWKDLRSGEILVPRRRLVASGTYAPAIGETFDSARLEAARRLAERIVEAMESDW
jgi:hypothetical protein